jgi:hypothetical protein
MAAEPSRMKRELLVIALCILTGVASAVAVHVGVDALASRHATAGKLQKPAGRCGPRPRLTGSVYEDVSSERAYHACLRMHAELSAPLVPREHAAGGYQLYDRPCRVAHAPRGLTQAATLGVRGKNVPGCWGIVDGALHLWAARGILP